LVAVSVMITVAPGTTAPLASTTRPVIVPRVVWAAAGRAITNATNAPAARIRFLRLPKTCSNLATNIVVISAPILDGTLFSHRALPLFVDVIRAPHSFAAIAQMISQRSTRGLRITTYYCVVSVFMFVAYADQVLNVLRLALVGWKPRARNYGSTQMAENVWEVMITSRSRNAKMKLKVRCYGFATVREALAEWVQGLPHFREVLIPMPDRGQCRRFGLETNTEFQHGQDIAESRYRSCPDAKILLSETVQNKRSDSMPLSHKSGGLQLRDCLPHDSSTDTLLTYDFGLGRELLPRRKRTGSDQIR
jgi:hypothetical protein